MSEQEFNMIFSKNLIHYLETRNRSQSDLAKYVGVSTAAVNTWCKGLKNPRMDKVDRICSFFQIKRSDLMEDKSQDDSSNNPLYYLNDESREAAQFLYENPDYKVLFDASRNVKPEDIQFVKEMIDRVSKRSDN